MSQSASKETLTSNLSKRQLLPELKLNQNHLDSYIQWYEFLFFFMKLILEKT